MKYFGQIKPKKSFSQNFLIDNNIAKKIVASLNLESGDIVIEIGCGTGALTKYLLEKKIILIGIELDKNAFGVLSYKFPAETFQNFHLLNKDILSINLKDYISQNKINSKVKIIGNIPYSISSRIFFWLFEQAEHIDNAVIMVQKELAERLTAKPKTKDYGILTIALQLTGSAKKLFDVPPECFYPKPSVTSSIIDIKFRENPVKDDNFKKIMKFVRAAFSQRRKTLKNSLNNYFCDKSKINYQQIIDDASLNRLNYFSQRAEELSKDDFIEFYNFLQNHFRPE